MTGQQRASHPGTDDGLFQHHAMLAVGTTNRQRILLLRWIRATSGTGKSRALDAPVVRRECPGRGRADLGQTRREGSFCGRRPLCGIEVP